MISDQFKKLALKKIPKLLAGLTLVVFFLLATYGANLSWSGHEKGLMIGCPLMGEMTQVCQMDATQHSAGWQKLFLAGFQSNTLQSLLLLLAALILTFWFFGRLRIFTPYAFLRSQSTYKKEIWGSPHDYLLRSLSNGILRKRE